MSTSRLAYNLALIGGILLIIFGVLGLFASSFRGFYVGWGFSGGSIVTIICGVIALLGATRVSDLLWSIILIVIGAIGAGVGGLLVLIGGVIGLFNSLSKHS